MRTLLLFALLGNLMFCGQVSAQPSQYESLEGNLGTWRWGKPQTRRDDEGEEREPGETSWERLNAERNAEAEVPPNQEIPKSLTPLQLWRLLRGKNAESENNKE